MLCLLLERRSAVLAAKNHEIIAMGTATPTPLNTQATQLKIDEPPCGGIPPGTRQATISDSRADPDCGSTRHDINCLRCLATLLTNTKSGGGCLLRRSSPCVVLMPQVGSHRWCFRGCGCCARCAAVRQGLRSLPGPQCVRAVLAVVVSGVRLSRRPCGSVLVLPGSAAGAASAAPDACRPGSHSPSSGLAWPGSCRSWDITSPRRLAGVDITSVPLLAKTAGTATIRTGRSPGQYHGVIKFLRVALNGGLTVRNCPRDLSLSLLARVCT
jgi:hypothetical protein